ncbi:hypothetical protein BDV34DRAFT_231724 [Aspergillus parasiticus]|uniref:MACPF-like domain-containing protein n=1 Tax=Aspergillus parasiticus TaxID=5067 RepID=A0A5N6D0W6_ASPPA|nr:hypothetical protein BDV34DRAFT_231724 [Aspergillus parasiticus]
MMVSGPHTSGSGARELQRDSIIPTDLDAQIVSFVENTPITTASLDIGLPKTDDPPKGPTDELTNGLVLTIYKYDKTQNKSKASFSTSYSPELAKDSLGSIRLNLLKQKALSNGYANRKFCTKAGDEVDDQMLFAEYAELNDEKPGKSRYSIYIRDKMRNIQKRAKLDEGLKTFLDQKLDLDSETKATFLEAKAEQLTSKFSKSDWQASANSDKVVHPALMSEKHWGIVMRNTNLLSGHVLQRETVEKVYTLPNGSTATMPVQVDNNGYKRSFYPAFVLKPREIESYNATYDLDSEEVAVTAAAQAEEKEKGVKQSLEFKLRIPRFQINDNTNVEVFETQGKHEKANAESGFMKQSLSAAVGGSYGPVSGGIKGGATWGGTTAQASYQADEKKYMHVVYNFPRVKLEFDASQLEVSADCKKDIAILRDERTKEALEDFLNKYGHIFATHIYLGGRLFSIEESNAVAGSTVEEKTAVMKAAASASISGYGCHAEVSYSRETNDASKTTKTEVSLRHSISWSAEGGDTTLCNNPPQWCPTVASFYNWRVIRQSECVNLIDLLAQIKGYEDIGSLVENIARLHTAPEDSICFQLSTKISEGSQDEQNIFPGDGTQDNLPGGILGGQPNDICFEVAVTDGKDIVCVDEIDGHGKTTEKRLRFRYGVKYPVQFRAKSLDGPCDPATKYPHGLQWRPTVKNSGDGFLFGSRNKASNVMIEFRRSGSPLTDLYVKERGTVCLSFSWPGHKDEGLVIEGNYMRTRRSAVDTLLEIHYVSDAAREITLEKHLNEKEKLRADAREAQEAAQKAKAAAAEADSEREKAKEAYKEIVVKARERLFPEWEQQKKVKDCMATHINDLQISTKMKEEENKMNALTALILSFEAGEFDIGHVGQAVREHELPEGYFMLWYQRSVLIPSFYK